LVPPQDPEKLLISVGSSSNVSHEEDWRRAKILTADTDGGNLRTFASGLRNAVFMAIHPVTGQVWATEMGRDFLGDDLPPDEINIVEEGRDYGWPVCYGKNIHDTDFDDTPGPNPCIEKAASYIDIPAHSAPLGLAFIPEKGWPKEYWHDLLVAYHGSWNRSEPTGYKIVRYKLDRKGNLLGEEDFISGWLTENNRALGRPVDILVCPGGIMYVSDDKAGVIYRVAYRM
jgi:glucose/arabinose dehydrogenase